jgi:hypothetical protein
MSMEYCLGEGAAVLRPLRKYCRGRRADAKTRAGALMVWRATSAACRPKLPTTPATCANMDLDDCTYRGGLLAAESADGRD